MAVHKQGASFDFSGSVSVTDGGTPVTGLDTWGIAAQIRRQRDNQLVADLTCEWLSDGVARVYTSADDTRSWPAETLVMDLRLTSPANVVVITDTAQITVIEGVTR